MRRDRPTVEKVFLGIIPSACEGWGVAKRLENRDFSPAAADSE